MRTWRRYLSAFALIRALRLIETNEETVSRVRKLGFDGGGFIVQSPEEASWLLARVASAQPRCVLEIGTAHAGTLHLWGRAATPDALLVAVDSSPLGRLGRWSPLAVLCRGVAQRSQRVELVFGVLSQSAETKAKVQRALAGNPVDFLFIDGDHSYEGVRQDFELYAPLVRPGGLIGFHDTSDYPDRGFGVPQLWAELKAEHETEEFVASSEPSYGVGLLRVPGP